MHPADGCVSGAVQYGSQLVPISDDSMLKLPEEQLAQSMQLLGFVDNDPDNPAIPRHHYMKVSMYKFRIFND